MQKKKESSSNQLRRHKRILYDLFVTIENIIIGNSILTRRFKDGCTNYKVKSCSNEPTVLLIYDESTPERGNLINNNSHMDLKEEESPSFNITTDLSSAQSVVKLNETTISRTKETDSQFSVSSENLERKYCNESLIGKCVINDMISDKKGDTYAGKTNSYRISCPSKGKSSDFVKEIRSQTEIANDNNQKTNKNRKKLNVSISDPEIIKQYSVAVNSKPEINHRRIVYDLFVTIENIIIGASSVTEALTDRIITFKIKAIGYQPIVLILYEIPPESENDNCTLQQIGEKEKHFSESTQYLSSIHSLEAMNVTALEAIIQQEEIEPFNLVSIENATNELHENIPGVKYSSQEQLKHISLESEKTNSDFMGSKLLYCKKPCKINRETSTLETEKNLRNVKSRNSSEKIEKETIDYRTKTFTKFQNIKRHEKKRTGEKPQYQLCETGFDNLSVKKCHQRKHTGKKPYKCEFCEKTFARLSLKIIHERQHTGDRPYKCEYCDKTFTQLSNKIRHSKVHSGEIPYKCEFCEKTFTLLFNKITHERKHTGEKPYKCKYCDKAFADSSSKKRHERQHTGEKPFKCLYCEKAYAQLFSKIIHERKHSGEKPYKCDYCDKAFADSSSKKRHERQHTGEKLFKCQYCEKTFARIFSKIIHERKHTGERPHKCDYCEKTFVQSHHKKRHEKQHIGEKSYKCDYCKKLFSEPSQKIRHERLHTGEKPYKCEYCSKTFVASSSKTYHERVHTGEKPYQCEYCEKTFALSSSKKCHERAHTGEKPYKCEYCDKTFALSSTKKCHERLHTAEKPYKCEYCEKTFATSSARKCHERRHTVEKPQM